MSRQMHNQQIRDIAGSYGNEVRTENPRIDWIFVIFAETPTGNKNFLFSAYILHFTLDTWAFCIV